MQVLLLDGATFPEALGLAVTRARSVADLDRFDHFDLALLPADLVSESLDQLHAAAPELPVLVFTPGNVERCVQLLTGRPVPSPQLISLDEALEDSLLVFRRFMGATIDIDRRWGCSRRVNLDAATLEQMVINLAVHARTSMPEGGTLSLETEDLGSRALLIVSDTGSGGPPELSITEALVQEAGGTLRISTRAEGTRLDILLPTVGPALHSTVPPAPPRAG